MARLRAPDGCPWDQDQTHQSIARCLVEEASEVLEAIDREDTDLLREELGDLLLQVVFHAQIEEEAERFDLEDVAREISEKLIRRHPHVFGDPRDKEEDAGAVIDRWEKIKAEEKKARYHRRLVARHLAVPHPRGPKNARSAGLIVAGRSHVVVVVPAGALGDARDGGKW